MKFIGITGGVGAGKSVILRYIMGHYRAKVLFADEIAKDLMRPGMACYDAIREAFPTEDIYQKNGELDSQKMARAIFGDGQKRARVNAIVHPAVKELILNIAKEARKSGQVDYLILEAALLIEEHYDEICDELWYIDTCEDIRRERLKAGRGYSDEKIDEIFHSQLSREQYLAHCVQAIDNNGSKEDTFLQIRKIFGEEK